MHTCEQQDSATAATAIQSNSLRKVTTGHANTHTVHTYADVLPIRGVLCSVTLGQSTFHAGGGLWWRRLFGITVIATPQKRDCLLQLAEQRHAVAYTLSQSPAHTITVVLITSICLKLCESAASCWFHRHVKTPLFFLLPSFSPSPFLPYSLLPPFPVSPCPFIRPFS